MRMFLIQGTLCLLAGCSSPSGGSAGAAGSGAVGGTLLGKTFTPADAASYSTNGAVTVVLYDASGVCGELKDNAVKPNSSALVFTLPGAAGGMTYTGVEVQFAEFDASCNSPAGESGSGKVTITAASASSVSGSFVVNLNADSVTGNFVAPTCAGAPGSGAQSCK